MLEPTPDLSSDLEWMLQSGQATTAMIVEALVEEYYEPVYSLGLVILEDEEAARQATGDTFCNALLNIFRYQSSTGIDVWLYRQALEAIRRHMPARILTNENRLEPGYHLPGEEPTVSGDNSAVWQALRKLPEGVRLPLAIHSLHGWNPEKIAQVFRIRPRGVEQNLRLGYQLVEASMNQMDSHNPANEIPEEQAKETRARLAGILRARWPAVKLSPDEVATTVDFVLSHNRRTGNLVRRFASFKEVFVVLAAALLIAGFIWGVNLIAPESETTPVPTRTLNPAGMELPNDNPAEVDRRTPPAKPTLTPTPITLIHTVLDPERQVSSSSGGGFRGSFQPVDRLYRSGAP